MLNQLAAADVIMSCSLFPFRFVSSFFWADQFDVGAQAEDNIGPKLINFVAGEICNSLQYIYHLYFESRIN